MSLKLTEKALLADLRIGVWSGRRYDQQASLSLIDTFSCSDPAYLTVSKSLVAKEEIKKILRIVNSARRIHYERTLPWRDNGARLLPGLLYLDFAKAIGDLKQQFTEKVESFCLAYPRLVKEAQGVLNGLFKSADYPTSSELRRKFSFTVYFSPISAASDLRVNLQADEINKLRHEIREQEQELLHELTRSLWRRLFDVIRPLVDKTGDPMAVFRDSLVNNVADLVELLPALNITQDADLTRMTNEIRQKLCRYSPAEIRRTEGVRGRVAQDADEILDRMKGYVGAAA